MDIKKLRKKLGITIEELAVKVGVTATTIYRWENSKVKPHRSFLKTMEGLVEKRNER